MERLASIGRMFFAIAMVVFGIQHLVYANFVTRVVPTWPAWIPGGRALWAYAVGVALIAAGAAILLRIGSATATVALVLAGALLLSVATLYLPRLIPNPRNGGLWTMTFKGIAFAGGAFAIARMEASARRGGGQEALLFAGRLFFGSFLFLAGVQHFIYADFVATMVPGWIPGSLFWAYFAGVALIAGGLGIVVPRTSRLAALLSGAMILTWFVVVHLPRAIGELGHGSNEMTALFEALAMSGIAFVLADSARFKPVGR